MKNNVGRHRPVKLKHAEPTMIESEDSDMKRTRRCVTQSQSSQGIQSVLEQLEPRMLLSGNVTAQLRDGTLYVTGTDAAEGVRIDRKGIESGGIRVSGDAGMTVNGHAWPALFRNDVEEVKIDLGGGDDRLTITRAKIKGDLRIKLGWGDDFLRIAQSQIWGNLDIRGGDGASTVQLRGTTIAKHTWVGTGDSDDSVNLGASTFNGGTEIKTRAGNDYIALGQATTQPPAIQSAPGNDTVIDENSTLSWDFRNGEQGWVGGFADYNPSATGTDADGNPISVEDFYQFESGSSPLLPDATPAGTGFIMSGINHSDDLFMFVKHGLGSEDGVIPGQTYHISFDVTFASKDPSGATAIGGNPYLKIGAAPIEPVAQLDLQGYLRMNVDIGRQANGGTNATVLGDIGNGLTLEESNAEGDPYISVRRSGELQPTVTAGPDGTLWIFVGTDSPSEVKDTIYYQHITVTLVPVKPE